MARVAIAMSGGVDSSTAAALLREQGHDLVGLTLQLWDYSAENLASGRGRCCSPADIVDARLVSDRLEMPHYTFDHSASFETRIVEPFVAGYLAGTTPSPCISCNRLVKFDLLWKLARGLGAEYLATGHYARVENGATRPLLKKARDADKDQSYFLFDVPRRSFENVIFPLGAMTKDEVRAAARRLDLAVADKAESFELCFIPDGDKNGFVERRRGASDASGPIRHVDGRVLGYHSGLHRFTVGQRRGIGVSDQDPLFVVEMQSETSTLVVGPPESLSASHLVAGRCNWVSIDPPASPRRAAARIRHRHREVPALLTPQADGRVRVDFDQPQRAVAPGQGVVFYDGDLLLGGGWIERG